MPLLPFGDSLYSASRRKSLKRSFETRLLAGGVLVIAPSSTIQFIGLFLNCTSHAPIVLPSKRATGWPSACFAFASHAAQVGGRTPVTLTLSAGVPTVPVSLPPAACSDTAGFGSVRPGRPNDSSPLAILASVPGTGLPPRLRNIATILPPSSFTSSQYT